jgi:hypothetical protein
MLKPLFNIQWWHHLQAQAKEASYEKIENSMKSANRKKNEKEIKYEEKITRFNAIEN